MGHCDCEVGWQQADGDGFLQAQLSEVLTLDC